MQLNLLIKGFWRAFAAEIRFVENIGETLKDCCRSEFGLISKYGENSYITYFLTLLPPLLYSAHITYFEI